MPPAWRFRRIYSAQGVCGGWGGGKGHRPPVRHGFCPEDVGDAAVTSSGVLVFSQLEAGGCPQVRRKLACWTPDSQTVGPRRRRDPQGQPEGTKCIPVFLRWSEERLLCLHQALCALPCSLMGTRWGLCPRQGMPGAETRLVEPSEGALTHILPGSLDCRRGGYIESQ